MKKFYKLRILLTSLKSAKSISTFILICGLIANSANAQTVNVSTVNDVVDGTTTNVAALNASPGPDGKISLREAILATNNEPNGTTINIVLPAGNHVLSIAGADATAAAGDLDINTSTLAGTKTVNITGAGAALTTITGLAGERIIELHAINNTGSITVTISGITFTGGSPAGSGGAILAGRPGDVTNINNCIFNANTATTIGGAISQSSSGATHDLSITNCSFTNNTATNAVGGAVNYSGLGNVTITGCTFTNNIAGTSGGAINVTGSAPGPGLCNILMNNFSGNTANGAPFGGAAVAMVNVSTININYNRIVGNLAPNVATGKMITTSGGVVGTMNTDNNWWGVNSGPAASDIVGTAAASWLQLKASASPVSICGAGATSTVTAGFLSNNLGAAVAAANLTALVGRPITFVNPVLGTLSAAQPTIQVSGTATVVFTSTGTTGTGSVNAVVDNVPNNDAVAKASITITSLTVTNPATTTGTVGTAFSQNFSASGGNGGPYTFNTASTLPTGLTLSAAGVLSGIPTQSGTFPIIVNASDGSCTGTGSTYNLVINCQTITVTNPAVTTATNGTVFSQTFTQTGALGGATFTINSGSLPNGLTLSTAGVLSGTPSAPAGPYTITVKVTDGNGCTKVGANYTLSVSCQAISVTNPVTTTGQVGVAFSQTFTQTGGIGSTTFSTASTLPAGLTLSTGGVLSGTSAAGSAGSYPIVVTATDANGCSGTGATYTLVISNCPTITVTNPATTTGTAGTAFNQPFGASGGQIPYNFTTASTLPTGLSLSSAGVLTGTPTQAGTFPIVVTATDANTCSGNGATYNLVIGCTAPETATATPSSQIICSGSVVSPIVLSGSAVAGTVYNWTRDNPAITGTIATSGSGDITGTLINATVSPVTVTFSIIPAYYGTCNGNTTTATVVVNPTPNVTVPTSQTFCNGTTVTTGTVNFTSTNTPAGTTTFTWTNNNTAIGLGSNGSGNSLPTFTATNGTSAPISGTIVVTPSYTNAGGGPACTGPTQSFTITVNPTPDVTQPASQIVCNNTSTAAVNFSGSVTGTTFSWVNNTPSIGLVANGTGNIPVFTATNATTAPITGTIVVTPQTSGSSTTTFANTSFITINDASPATPYPSTINVSGLAGTITSMTVKLKSFSHTFPDDVDVLLVGPGGQNAIIMSDVGGGNAANNITLTLDDAAASGLPDSGPLSTGTFKPTNFGVGDIFSAPAPAPSGGSALSVFNSTVPNGTWSLYVMDDLGGDVGSINGGWELTITTAVGGGTCTGTPKTFTITVNPTPTVTAPANQIFCNGATISTGTLNFTSTNTPAGTTTFTWTNNNTAIGLASSGSGNSLPTFTTTNATAGPISGTIVVTPSYTNADGGPACTGPTQSFTITVNPPPSTANAGPNQTRCSSTGTATMAANEPTMGGGTWSQISGPVTANIITPSSYATSITGMTTAGTYVFQWTISNTPCPASSSQVSIIVNTPPVVSNPAVSTGQINVPFSQTFTQAGGSGTVTFTTASTLPTGLSLSTAGVLSGTPTQTGTFPIVVTASNGCSANGPNYNLVINACPIITVTNPAVTTGTAGTAFNQFFTQSGGALPVAFSTVSNLPTGLTLSGAGVLSGTPTQAGTFPILVTVTDNTGCTGTGPTYNLVIACPVLPITAGSNSPVCNGSDLNLTSTAGFVSYSWTGPNGFASTSQNPTIPSVTAAAAGTYTVTATGSTPSNTPATLSFSQVLTGGVPPTVAQCNAWNSYRASLVGTNTYTGFTIHGSQNAVGISCTDPVVATAVANALRTETFYSGSSDGQTWTVTINGCTLSGCGGNFVELANQGSCSCSPGYSIRPNINNINWGGINGPTCGAASQTLQLDFTFTSACTYSSSVTVAVTPPPVVGLTPPTQTICSGSKDSISVTPIIVSPVDFEQAAGLATNKGLYFDISNSSPIPLTVNSIRLEMVPPASAVVIAGQYKIYMTTGASTAVGNYNIPANWTLLQSPTFAFPAGAGNLVYFSDVPLGANSFTLQPGASKGIYLEATTASFMYAYRNAASVVPSVTDGNITLNTRNSASGIFTASGADRTYYGKIGYASALTYSWTRDNTTNVTGTSSGTIFPIKDALNNTTNVPQTTIYTVTASQGAGCTTSTATASVTVNPTPNAIATPPSQTTCSGSAITTIVLSSSVTGTTFTWIRDNPGVTGIAASGSGDISGSLTNATNAPITVTFSITPSNTTGGTTCGGIPITATVTVNPLPTATITGTITTCAGSPSPNITFTGALGTAPYTFTYNINGGGNQTVTTVVGNSVTVAVPTGTQGIFTYNLVSVMEGSANACTQAQSSSATVTIIARPTGVLSGGGVITCAGTPITLNVAVTGTAPFSGTLSDGTPFAGVGPNIPVQVSPSSTITYTIATLNDANCTSQASDLSGSALVTVNPRPSVLSAIGGGDVCTLPYNDITFNFTGTPPFNLTIKNTTTNSSFSVVNVNSNSYTFSPNAAGTYQVTALSDVNCTSIPSDLTTTQSTQINPSITPSVSISTNTGLTICNSVTSVTYTATSTPFTSDMTSFQWKKNGNTVFIGNPYTDNAPANGDVIEVTYTVNTSTYPCVTQNPVTSQVTLTKLPVVSYGSLGGSDQTVCAGGDPAAMSFGTLPAGSGSFTYQWYYKDGVGTACPTGSSTAGWTLIGGATGTSYDPTVGEIPAGTTRTFSVLVTPAGTPTCGSAGFAGNCRVVTMLPTVFYGNVSGTETICPNSKPNPKTVTGTTGSGSFTYQWYSNSTGLPCPSGTAIPTGWQNLGFLDGANSPTYTPPVAINQNTTYAVFVTPTGTPSCGVGMWAGCAVVTVGDFTPPVITCHPGGNTSRNTDAGLCTWTALGTNLDATATDNCILQSITYTLTGATTGSGSNTVQGVTFNKGVTTLTWKATDAVGNSSTCSFNLTVNDNQLPVVTCPFTTPQSRNTNVGVCTWTSPNTNLDATATDNCPGQSVAYVLTGVTTGSGSSLNGVVFNKGLTTITWTATDASGNTSSCSFTLTVVDAQAPVVTCPVVGNTNRNTNNNLCTWVSPNTNLDATATDNCPGQTVAYVLTGATSGSGSSLNGVIFNKGLTTITWTATDASGNTASCSFTLTVIDAQVPVVTCPVIGNTNRNTNNNLCTWVSPNTNLDATATDNCPGQTVAYVLTGVTTGSGSTLNGVVFNKGLTTITWTATDGSGNTSSCSFTLTVVDNQLPVVTCPFTTTQTKNTDAGVCTYTVSGTEFNATATDNCTGQTVAYTLTGVTTGSGSTLAGVILNKGTTTITWTATDASGNTSSCSFAVLVQDKQLPVITCPFTTTQVKNTNAGVCTYTVSGTEFNATATDNCPGQSVAYTLTGVTTGSGSSLAGVVLNKGTTTITWTATDASGNTSSCSFAVLVQDKQLPVVTCPFTTTQTKNTDAGVCTYTVSGTEFNATATDNCTGQSVAYALTGATSGNGSSLAGVILNKGTTTITWTATDASGNTSSCSFAVLVQDKQLPVVTCPFSTTQTKNTDAGVCTYTVSGTEFNATATDNCTGQTVAYVLTGATTGSGSTLGGVILNKGTTTITWTATDASGNTSSCSFDVLVKDKQLPVVTCPFSTTQTKNTDGGVCTYTVSGTEFNATATDNCTGQTVAYVLTGATTGSGASLAGVLLNKGTTLITWTATDASGNTAVCSFSVTVQDKELPVVTCPFTTTQTRNADPGVCTYTVQGTEFRATVTDNCPGSTQAYVLSGATTGSGASLAGVLLSKGTTLITWNATDASGNTSSCSFSVTVVDSQNPVVTCPFSGNVNRNANNNLCTYAVVTTEFNATATDNCAGQSVAYTLTGATTGSGSSLAGILLNKGVTTVTWKASDASGNSSTCSFTVTVIDNQVPVVTCPSAQSFCYVAPASTVYTIPALTFTDNCPGGTIAYSITGPGGFTRSGSGANASGTFAIGVNTVSYTVTDASGNTATCSTTVTIKATPTATLTNTNGPNVCAGSSKDLTVTFTGTAPFTFVYSINGVNQAPVTTSSNPYTLTVTPVANTTYALVSISDQVGCPGGTVSGSTLVVVKPLPTATVQGNADQTICAGQSATIPIVFTGGQPYSLSYTDGTTTFTINNITTNNYNLVVSPTSTTTYTLTGVVDGIPCTGNVFGSAVITVNQSSVAPTSATASPATICNGQSSTLTEAGGTLGTGATYHWYSDAGFTQSAGTGPSITVSPTATTTYYVRVEGTAAPCSTTPTSAASVTVTVNQPSVAPTAAAATVNPVCNGGSTTLTQTGGTLGTGAVYKWYTDPAFTVPAGTGSGATGSLTVSPSATTTYYVRAEGTAAPCSTVTTGVSITITVNQGSVAPSGATASPATICKGSSTTLTEVGGTLGTGATYHWYKDAAFTQSVGTGNSISVSPTTTTTYYVRAEGTASPCSGNTTAASVTVTVDQLAATAAVTGQPSCTTSSNAQVTVTATGSIGTVTYSLSGGTITGTATNSTGVFSGLGAGTYTYSVSDAQGCTSVSGTVTVTAPSPVTTSLVSKIDNSCHGAIAGKITVQATGGASPYSYVILSGPTINTTGATSGAFTGLAAGNYTIQATGAGGCSSNVVSVTINDGPAIGTGIPDVSIGSSFTGNFFPTIGSANTIIYNLTELSGNAAVGDTIRVITPAGYTFSFDKTLTTAGGQNLDNARWNMVTIGSAVFIILNGDPNQVNQIGCNTGSVRVAVTLTRTSSQSGATFTITGQLRLVNGEVNANNNKDNGIVFTADPQ